MAASMTSTQYMMPTVELQDSRQMTAVEDAKPKTPPPIPIQISDRTPPSKARGPTGQAPQRQISYTSMKRDILYGAINEFKLTGSKLSAYDELLTRLNFDTTPTISQGRTWFSCRGRRDGRTACSRMVPEVYFRTAVGKLLRAADRAEVQGDDMIEELAAALSYAICSEHNRNIHKVVRAIKFQPVVQQWREERLSGAVTPPATAISTSLPGSKDASSPTETAPAKATTAKPASPGGTAPAKSAPAKAAPALAPAPAGATKSANNLQPSDAATDSYIESMSTKPFDIRSRIRVEQPYPDFFREADKAASRERRSGSTASATTASTSSTNRSKSKDRRFAERLGLGR